MYVCTASILQPHLHSIVRCSTELAQRAVEPLYCLLLLRSLFRSISYNCQQDRLQAEFLQLFPSLLHGAHSSIHNFSYPRSNTHIPLYNE